MYKKDSPSTIQSMFNGIAKRYDFTNSVLSLSLHKYWNRSLVKQMKSHPSPSILLDLCAGTGDIAFDYLKFHQSPCHAILIDFSSEMLNLAKEKAKALPTSSHHELSWIQANVEEIPLANNFAHSATMAYGIRNVQNPALCIQEVFRVLQPGGSFGILELTRPNNPALRWFHGVYLQTLMPLLGKWLTKNSEAYHYLSTSVQTFIAPEKLMEFFSLAGFIQVKKQTLSGGIATIIIGQKPA